MKLVLAIIVSVSMGDATVVKRPSAEELRNASANERVMICADAMNLVQYYPNLQKTDLVSYVCEKWQYRTH